MQTTIWTGASHSGRWPAWFSSRMPMKRSIEPQIARWIMTGVVFSLLAAM